MDLKLLARIGAIAFVALAIVVTVIQMRAAPKAGQVTEISQSVPAPAADPLADELAHCQSIGQAGATDPGCLRAWAENRRRFLAPDAPPQASRLSSSAPAGGQ